MTVVPTGNRLPVGTPERVIVAGPALSPAVAVPRAASLSETPHAGGPACWLVLAAMLAGAVICGGTLSITVMVCVAAALLPLASVAMYMRTMTSGSDGDPAPPLFDSLTVMVGVPQLSMADASLGLAAGTPKIESY